MRSDLNFGTSNVDRLPRTCMSRLMTDGSPIMIKLGESGYHPCKGDLDPDDYNKSHGITPAQVAAMEAGSMFGWEIPGADPDNELNQRYTDFPYKDQG